MPIYYNKEEIKRRTIMLYHGLSIMDLNNIINKAKKNDLTTFKIDGYEYKLKKKENKKSKHDFGKITNMVYDESLMNSRPFKKLYSNGENELTIKDISLELGIYYEATQKKLKGVESFTLYGENYKLVRIKATNFEKKIVKVGYIPQIAEELNLNHSTLKKYAEQELYTKDGFKLQYMRGI